MRRPGCSSLALMPPTTGNDPPDWLGGCGTLARVQRQHDIAIRVQMIHGQLDAPVTTRSGDVDLCYGFAFGNANAQGVRQDAFDRDGLHQWDHLQVPLNPHEIERQQILLRLDPRPAPQLVHRDNAVGLHVNLLDGERFVLIDQAVERPFAGAVKQIQAKDGREDGPQAYRGHARPCGADLAGAQFHVQHLLAAQPPVLWFTFKPHLLFRFSARSTIRWQSSA